MTSGVLLVTGLMRLKFCVLPPLLFLTGTAPSKALADVVQTDRIAAGHGLAFRVTMTSPVPPNAVDLAGVVMPRPAGGVTLTWKA